MADTNFGLGSLFQEEGPGRTGSPRVLPQIDNSLVQKIDDQRSFLDYFQEEDNLGERISELFVQPEQVFGGYQRPEDGRVVQFGLPTEFNEEELLSEYNILQEMPPVSQLKDRKAVADVAKRLESLPENDPIFAESPLDQLATEIDDTLAQLQPKKEVESPIEKTLRRKEADLDPTVSQDEIEQAAMAGLNDYLEAVRGAGPDTKVKDLDEYKKKFAEATGIDISGKVDKSHALMSFGLALMQNKAGKNFNIGKMLGAVGEAGQAALPALEKAKTQARNDAIAAGKFALTAQASDEATDAANKEKMMNRGKYWVYKKGGKGEEFVNFDEGEFVDLNKYELNNLINNPDFDRNYEFIDGSSRLDILAKRAEGLDLGDMWSPPDRVSLIGGNPDEAPPELQLQVAAADPNYKGTTPTNYKLLETDETVIRRFMGYQKSINSGAQKFEALIENLNKGISIPKQILSGMQQTLRSFGIDAGSMPSNVADAKRMLNNLAIDEATNILQESGKTLSDNDRKLVKDRIGQISWTSGDVELIKRQLEDIYDLTVLKPQRNLDRSIDWLERNAGISFEPKITKDELAIINEGRKARGEPPLTMDDYK